MLIGNTPAHTNFNLQVYNKEELLPVKNDLAAQMKEDMNAQMKKILEDASRDAKESLNNTIIKLG